MAIKAYKKMALISFLLIGGFFVGPLLDNSRIPYAVGSNGAPKTSGVELLVDKIFLFEAPNDTRRFDNQTLEANYNYRVLVEIVTPHDCQINVTIIDPVLDVYHVFRTDVNISQDDKWFDFPFGTVLSGNYTFIFSVKAELNLNILIQISYDPEYDKCLYDIMSPDDIAKLKLYNVTKFYNRSVIEHQVSLKTDYYYKFYVGRVSSIGGVSPSESDVRADYDIDDPVDKPYKIYANKTLANVGFVVRFDFATAVEGNYTITIAIHCAVEAVNVAYSIVEDYQKSTVNDGNTTIPDPTNTTDPEPTNTTIPSSYFYVPMEWTIAFGAGSGVILAILVVVLAVKKRKDSVSLQN